MGVHTGRRYQYRKRARVSTTISPRPGASPGSSAIRGPPGLGRLVQLVVDVEPFEDELGGAGGCGVAGVGVGELRQELPGQFLGLLLQAGDPLDPVQDLLRRLRVADLDPLARLEVVDRRPEVLDVEMV